MAEDKATGRVAMVRAAMVKVAMAAVDNSSHMETIIAIKVATVAATKKATVLMQRREVKVKELLEEGTMMTEQYLLEI